MNTNIIFYSKEQKIRKKKRDKHGIRIDKHIIFACRANSTTNEINMNHHVIFYSKRKDTKKKKNE